LIPYFKQIHRIALPMMAASVSVPLLGVVDTAILGHLDSSDYLAAVNIGVTAMNMLIWGFGFLRMSTVGLVAQAAGSGDHDLTAEHMARALSVAVILGVVVVLSQFLWLPALLWLLADGGHSEVLARQYLEIRLWAVPFHLLLFVVNGYFLAVDRARLVLWLTLISQVGNMLLDYLLVMVFHLDVRGVAWGSLISQAVAAAFGIRWLVTKGHLTAELWRQRSHWWQRSHLKSLLNLNSDVFIRTVCLMAVFALMTRYSAEQGTLILAVNAVLLNFFYITSYALDGYAHAIESISGRLYGQRDWPALRAAVTSVFKVSALVAFLMSLLFVLSGQTVVSMLTDLENIRNQAEVFLIWVYVLPLAAMLGFIYDGLCVGITASKIMRNAMLIATCLAFIPGWYLSAMIFPEVDNNHRLWAVFTLFFIVRGLMMHFMVRNQSQKLR
jgi:MATE family multidrug resistance protein